MTISDIESFAHATGIYDFMNTKWGWPSIESLHYLGLATLLGTVGLFDLRLLGFARDISIAALHKFVPLGVVAYLNNILTGSLFFVTAPDQYAYNPSFQLKVVCMVIAGINVAVFYTTTSKSVKALEANVAVPFHAKLIAVVSLTSWIGVIIFGRIITAFRPPFHWCFWC
jgi:hypothetical protein